MAAMRAHNIGFYKPSLWHCGNARSFAFFSPILVARFHFARCPFQTGHHHLKTKTQLWLENGFVYLHSTTFFSVVSTNNMTKYVRGVKCTQLFLKCMIKDTALCEHEEFKVEDLVVYILFSFGHLDIVL